MKPNSRVVRNRKVSFLCTARKLGVALPAVEATTAEELDIAFASAAAQHADVIVVFGDAPRELSRSRRNIISPRFISSDNSPMAD
jgi:hypothetical protein